jgi:hypothetical protein
VLRVSCLFDAFFQTPALLFVGTGCCGGALGRPLALFYAGAAVPTCSSTSRRPRGPDAAAEPRLYLPFNLPG